MPTPTRAETPGFLVIGLVVVSLALIGVGAAMAWAPLGPASVGGLIFWRLCKAADRKPT